jgi:hypothetical protein
MAVVRNLNGFVEGLNTYWVESHGGAVAQLMPLAGSGLTPDTAAASKQALLEQFPHSRDSAYWIIDPMSGEPELTTMDFLD